MAGIRGLTDGVGQKPLGEIQPVATPKLEPNTGLYEAGKTRSIVRPDPAALPVEPLLSRLHEGTLYAGAETSVLLFPENKGAGRQALMRLSGEPRLLGVSLKRVGKVWHGQAKSAAGSVSLAFDPATGSVRTVSPTGSESLSLVSDPLARLKNDPQWPWASAALESVQQGLKQRFGISDLYIGGGSARALLDAVYLGRKLEMRDLDVFVIAGPDVSEHSARAVGEGLESPELGVFSADDLRPRPRGNPELPEPARSLYNTGYGFFFKHEEDVFDLIMVKTQKDLSLNGLFDFDSVLLKIGDGGLEPVLEQLRKKSPAGLIDAGLLSDPDKGYEHWLSGAGTVSHWAEVEREPMAQALRIARSLTKIGHSQVPDEILPRLRRAVDAEDRKTSPLQIVRGFMKVLEDKQAGAELKMIRDSGVLRRWCPALHNLFGRLERAELERLIGAGSAEERLERILNALAPGERLRLLRDLRAVKVAADPALVQQHIAAAVGQVYGAWTPAWPEGVKLSALLANAALPVDFSTEVERVTRSATLHAGQKLELLVRAVLRRVPEAERGPLLGAWFPKSDPALHAQRLADAARARVGVFTGVINPLHLGHRDVLSAAVENAVLDRLYVVPTPKTEHNEDPITWTERLEMARLGLASLPEAEVVTDALGPVFEAGGTGAALKALDQQAQAAFGAVGWIHVMGADSFERYRDKGYLAGARKEQKSLFVVHRDGFAEPEIPPEYRDIVVSMPLVTETYGEQARASSLIRKLRAQGQPIDGLVGRSVKLHIETHGLYAPEDKDGA